MRAFTRTLMDDRFSAAEQRKMVCERPPRSLRSRRILPFCEGESRRRRQGVTRTPSRIHKRRSGDRIFRRYAAYMLPRFPSTALSRGYILPPLRVAFQG
jgi:hypothetical protein